MGPESEGRGLWRRVEPIRGGGPRTILPGWTVMVCAVAGAASVERCLIRHGLVTKGSSACWDQLLT